MSDEDTNMPWWWVLKCWAMDLLFGNAIAWQFHRCRHIWSHSTGSPCIECGEDE